MKQQMRHSCDLTCLVASRCSQLSYTLSWERYSCSSGCSLMVRLLSHLTDDYGEPQSSRFFFAGPCPLYEIRASLCSCVPYATEKLVAEIAGQGQTVVVAAEADGDDVAVRLDGDGAGGRNVVDYDAAVAERGIQISGRG